MYFVVQHDIDNREDFWTSAQRNIPALPQAGVRRVLNVFPNQTLDKATFIWEADSLETLQAYLQENLGAVSNESVYQINEAAAVGLAE